MKHNPRLRRSEAGQALVLVTIILLLTMLLIPSLLSLNFAATRQAQTQESRTLEFYAADAGIEDAMYQIKNLDELGLDQLVNLQFGEIYQTQTPSMNDSTLEVTVEKVWLPEGLGYPVPVPGVTDLCDKLVVVGMLASAWIDDCYDDFESGDFSGGEGWLNGDPWEIAGDCGVIASEDAYQGDWHMVFSTSAGEAKREVDLSQNDAPHLQFYAKAGSFKPGDEVTCKVRDDGAGGEWTAVKTWVLGDDDDTYRLVDIDLSPFAMATDFAVGFYTQLSGGTVASEGFESGDYAGGSGWLGSWDTAGDCSVLSDGREHGGSYHLRLRRSTGYAEREVDLSAHAGARLQFWARVRDFESSDTAWLKVFDGANWHDVEDWGSADSDDTYHYFDIDLSAYPQLGPGDYKVAFDANMNGFNDYFYIDDLEIVDQSYFCVDDLMIAEEGNVYKIEVAYTDADVGPAWMDSLGVWLPAGFDYVKVIETNGITSDDPVETPNYHNGTALVWDFSGSPINLNPGGQLPIVRDITLSFKPSLEPTGVFSWIKTQEGYESWDSGCELYKVSSTASHVLSGSGTRVEAYVIQGEVDRQGAASYGNYRATGNPLLIDTGEDETPKVKETPIDPLDPGTWRVVQDILYDGRSAISSIPTGSEVVAAWLYWSAFHESSAADTEVEFMHPKRYYWEVLGVTLDGNGDDTFVTDKAPVVTLPRGEVVYTYPMRNRGELLGEALSGNGNETFATMQSPIETVPRAEYVYLDGFGILTAGDDYDVDYETGQVKIINDSLEGAVTIDYSTAGLEYLAQGVDYMIDDPYAGQITIINDDVVGNVAIDYCAEKWDAVTHEAYNKYGMPLDPALEYVDLLWWEGYAYACFADVTDLVGGNGNGEFAVRGVDAAEGTGFPEVCYSGWSLIVVYQNETETAHQFYLYDPIHNAGECPFVAGDGLSTIKDIPFTLRDFYPPEGTVDGRLTYFIGEGDEHYPDDSVSFKGASQPVYTHLSGPNNPVDNVCNEKSTTGESGVDIDSFDVTGDVGSDTEANLKFSTQTDIWYLVYVVLSFKTDVTPKQDYSFNVGTVAYHYELTVGE